MIKKDDGLQSLGGLFGKVEEKKPPAYQWQEVALNIIKEFNVPFNRKSSVFKACKDKHKNVVARCITDTRELCKSGEKWRYFFKLINESSKIKDKSE